MVTLDVAEDQWVGAQNDDSGYGSNSVVAEGGLGERLNLWQPGPPGAWQYNRRAYFGFDVSSINLEDVIAATFTVTTAGDMVTGENGRTIYYWIHADNSGGDEFDETTLSKNLANTLGLNANGSQLSGAGTPSDPYLPNELGEATLLQSGGVGIAAAGGLNTITFSASALAELLEDTNGFVTISAFAGAPTGGTYGGGPIADAPTNTNSVGFISKEGGTPAQLSLTLIPEPSSSVLTSLVAFGLMLRRKR